MNTSSPYASPTPTGRVIWITGLPGSGKTTLATALIEHIKAQTDQANKPNTPVLLDGDDLRQALKPVAGGYDLQSRQKLAQTYAQLATMLAQQGVIVVVATVSGFESVRQWNRQHAPGYVEVYLKTAQKQRQDNQKDDLYRKHDRGEVENLVGVDVAYQPPQSPMLTLGEKGLEPIDQRVQQIMQLITC